MFRLFKRKKEKVPYVPQGRVGYFRKNQPFFAYTIIVEETGRIGSRSRVKILTVSIDRDCGKSESACLKNWGYSNWISTNNITWETDEQRQIRLGTNNTFLVDGVVTEVEEPDLRSAHLRTPPQVFDIGN